MWTVEFEENNHFYNIRSQSFAFPRSRFPSRFLAAQPIYIWWCTPRGNPICSIGEERLPASILLPRPICVRVFGAREGAFVYPKLDFVASVIEFQVRLRGQLLIRLRPIWLDIPPLLAQIITSD